MSVPEERDESRKSDLAVMDAQEYKQKRRLRRILDAREDVEEVGQEAFRGFIAGDISSDALNVSLLRAVQSYIRECHTLLKDWRNDTYETDEWDPYWTGDPTEPDSRPLGRVQFENRDDIVFWGLRDVLRAQDFYEESWTKPVENRHGPDTVAQKSRQKSVPENVSQNAYLRLNEFLAEEKDLELQFEDMDDSLPVWGFEEVDENGDVD
jgi:hypothetical protein